MIKRKMGFAAICAASMLTATFMVFGQSISALAATGTVTSSNVKVRAEASTSSQQVSSLDSGDKVDIIDETTDSQGYVWYRIYVNGQEYGYVRSDLVSKSGSTTSQSTEKKKESLPETQVSAIEAQAATVTVASANVRAGAGTGYDTVGTVANGDTITVTGEANGTDSKKWYQIQFGSSSRTGFVRADLVQIGAPAPADNGGDAQAADGEGAETAENVDGENAEGTEETQEGAEQAAEQAPAEPAVVGNGEFSLAYKPDSTGNEVWYLYDNVQSTQVKLDDLLTYAAAGQQAETLKTQVGKLKIGLIAMAVVIAVLVLVVLLLIYKLRDYAYYEEEEEEIPGSRKKDQYEEMPPQKNSKRSFDKAADEPRSAGRTVADSKRPSVGVTADKDRKKGAPMGTAASLMNAGKSSSRVTLDDEPRQVTPDRRSDAPRQTSQAPAGRKSRNFLLDDEDFEFEFLDLDDDNH